VAKLSGRSQSRFFVLQGGSLKYYGTAEEPKGVLDLGCALNFAADLNPLYKGAHAPAPKVLTP
jgi:hypothetical protein